MSPKMNFKICVLMFINLTFALHAGSENETHYSNHDILRGAHLNAIPTASIDLRSELNNQTSTDVPVSSESDDALKETVTKHHLGSSENSSETDITNIILARRLGIVWKRVHELLLAKILANELENDTLEFGHEVGNQFNSKSGDDSKLIDLETLSKTDANHSTVESRELNKFAHKLQARGRQFVFHPYLPYGKEVMPDEKISFHDVLPIKMVKFIKGMVEDAPWEQMFMKMVRMVVDQFVDKIIEKMFAHHEEEDDKWRSLDGGLKRSGNDPKHYATSVVRLRRSAVKSKLEKEDEWGVSGFSTENRLSKEDQHKEKGTQENQSWLDSILDYLFPDDPKADLNEDSPKTRRKRDTESPESGKNLEMPDILNTFFVKLYELQTGEVASEQLKSSIKKVVRHQLISSVLQFNSVAKGNATELNVTSTSLHNSSNDAFSGMKERWRNILKPEHQAEVGNSSNKALRQKRSIPLSEDKEDSKRLWQANRRSRPMNLKGRGECSLRRACNTGRLLARLPSVKDVTLQLKSYGKEPHWDALVWGMTKKKCSKIFCKRQRSPKGSKQHWGMEERRHYRNNIPSTRSPRFKYDESDPASVSTLLQRYE